MDMPIKIAILGLFFTQAYAYEVTFFNRTKTPIAIAIQYSGAQSEPLYKRIIKPKAKESFTPGQDEIPDIKWSLCLGNIYYAKNPTFEERKNYLENARWKRAHVTWVNAKLTSTPKKHMRKKKLSKKGRYTPITTKKKALKKDLCKDKHFEIVENKKGMIAIITSAIE